MYKTHSLPLLNKITIIIEEEVLSSGINRMTVEVAHSSGFQSCLRPAFRKVNCSSSEVVGGRGAPTLLSKED